VGKPFWVFLVTAQNLRSPKTVFNHKERKERRDGKTEMTFALCPPSSVFSPSAFTVSVPRFAIANPSFRPRVQYCAIEFVWFMGNVRKMPTLLTTGIARFPRNTIRRANR
jgi:hypothetical protein